MSEAVNLDFNMTSEELLTKAQLIFEDEDPTELTLFTMIMMIKRALKNRALSWSQLKTKGITRSRVRSLEKRLHQPT
jgi:hypothetical protein